MTNNVKIRCATMVVLIAILSLLGAGCIGDAQTDYNLKYDFDRGDRFVYNITHSTEKPKNTVPIHIEMLVSDFDGNNITTNVTSIKTTDGNTTESSYTVIMDIHGNLMKTYPEDKIIPEIQPELPNLIIYSEKVIQEGDSWTVMFNKTINYTLSGILPEYEVVGTKNHTCIGLKTVSTKAGRFECVGIKSYVNFTSNTKTETDNATVYTTTTGKLSGEDWVDVKGGFLVKSEYNVDNVMTTDLSEMYGEIGFENFYREIPIIAHITSELANIHKAQ
ncbi:MAG: hypothetical protein C5S48_04600 [Candidatus Methanogaster sp.]|nr:MAG: hypothetical protein C5S48_04600 [ANME-2 cluster archaeon]